MVPQLLDLLEGSRGAEIQKEVSLAICNLCVERYAVRALSSLAAGNADHKTALVSAGAIPPLVRLLESDDKDTQGNAACALANLAAGNEDHETAIVSAGAIPSLVRLLESKDKDTQRYAVCAIANLAGGNADHTTAIVSAGAIPHLVRLLYSKDKDIQCYAAATLAALAAGNAEHVAAIVAAGAIPPLVRRLRSKHKGIRYEAACAIANLANAEHAAAIVSAGAIPSLVCLLERKDKDTQHPAACAIANLANGNAEHAAAIVSAGAIPSLVRLLGSKDEDVQHQAVRALTCLADENDEHNTAIVSADAIPPVVQLLGSEDKDVQSPAAVLLAALTAGGADQIAAIVSAGAIPRLLRLLDSTEAVVQGSAALAYACLNCNGFETRSAMVSAGVVPVLLRLWESTDGLTQAVENEIPRDRVVHLLEQAVLAHGRPAPAVAYNSPKSNTPSSLDSSAATYAALSPSPPAVASSPWGFDSAPATPAASTSGPTPHHYNEQRTPVPFSAPQRHERAPAVVLKPSPAGLLFGTAPEVAGVAASSSTAGEAGHGSGVCSMSASELADVFASWEVQPHEALDAGQPIKPTGDMRQWFRNLCVADSGILYEDNYIQVGMRSSYQGPSGQISLCLNNKHTRPLQRLVCNVRPTPALSLQLGPVPADLEPRQEVVLPLSVACSAPFMRPPVLHLGYTVAGTSQAASITLDLPVVLTKFCMPMEVSLDLFNAKWDQVAGPPLKLSKQVTRIKPMLTAEVKNLLASINVMPLPVLWSEPSIISAACIFHCGTDQVYHGYNRIYALYTRRKLAASGTLRLEGCDVEGGVGKWQDVELKLEWLGVQGAIKKLDAANEIPDETPSPQGGLQAEQETTEAQSPGPAAATAAPAVVPARQDLELAAEARRDTGGAAVQAKEASDGEAAGNGGLANGEEEDHVAAKTLHLRLSYRVIPAAVAAALAAAGPKLRGKSMKGKSMRRGRTAKAVSAVQLAAEQASGTEVTTSIVETDVTPLPKLAHCYAHGGFMGLAVSMMSDASWRDILKQEDPSSYKKAYTLYKLLTGKKSVPTKRLSVLMTCLENSPVLCAYGLLRSGCTTGDSRQAEAAPGSPGAASAAAAVVPPAGEAVTVEDGQAAQGLRPPAANIATTAAAAAAPGPPSAAAAAASAAAAAASFAERIEGAAVGMEAPPLQQMESPVAAGAAAAGAARDMEGAGEAVAGMEASAVTAPQLRVMEASAVTAPAAASADSGGAVAGTDAFHEQHEDAASWVQAAEVKQEAGEAEEESTPQLYGMFLSRSPQQSKQLEQYLASIKLPNRYGYRPIGLEWDLWIHPTQPALLQRATVDHGTAGQLVTQAITTSLPCLRPLAKRAGRRQIKLFGVSPVHWLNALGSSLNRAVNGDRSVPLPLYGKEEHFYRLQLVLARVHGGEVSCPGLWDGVYAKAFIDSAAAVVPDVMARPVPVGEAGCTWDQEASFWPLPPSLDCTDLVVEVRGDPAGLRRDKALGMVRLPLGTLLEQHPQLGTGDEVELELPIEPKSQRLIHRQTGPQHGLAQSQQAKQKRGDATGAGEAHGRHEVELATPSQASGHAGRGRGSLLLRLRLENVGVLAAAESLGVEAAAAQTCAAMLSKPGGLYLDIKSAYSSAYDIQLFVTMLAGIGIHCKAVCSFSKHQLAVGHLADTVLFFHGISGLENACDDGVVERGQFVLFNGASFLLDPEPVSLKALPAKKAKETLGSAKCYPVDPFVMRKYTGLCETYGFAGGIYVQEPDASPASVSALAELVADFPEYFPLGFAYGHLSGLGVSFLDQSGRGFAAQQVVEEFQARKELSGKVMRRIKKGGYRQLTMSTSIAWGQRILYGSRIMSLSEQRTFIILLSQIWPYKHVSKVVEELGGIPRIFLRFFEQYELTTPLTLLEAGFNISHTKDVIRLLRNRGVIAALPLEEKVELGRFFCSRQLRGYGLTWVLMLLRIRIGLHKFAKEGLLCLLESCTQEEYRQVVSALGGRRRVEGRLRGRLRLSWHYTRRLADVERTHQEDPQSLAYQEEELRYGMLPRVGMSGKVDPCHFRDKTWGEQSWRAVRKASCCGFTLSYVFVLSLATCFTFLCCCVGPRICGTAAHGVLGVSALLAFILFVAMVVLLAVLVPWGNLFPDDSSDLCIDPLNWATYPCCNTTLVDYLASLATPCCEKSYLEANQALCSQYGLKLA
ncbi:hypothetical protein N2152v2_003961 [Parachlorella kessleri]